MTREEAIDRLKEARVGHYEFLSMETLNMAIKALEQEPKYCDRNICMANEYNRIGCEECEVTKSQEPCEDAISRNAVLGKAVYTETEEGWSGYTVDVDYIKSLPSVKPQQPCGDLISRQAVLDIIRFEDKWLLDAKGHNADTEIAFGGMKSKIADLPSVKPQKNIVNNGTMNITL